MKTTTLTSMIAAALILAIPAMPHPTAAAAADDALLAMVPDDALFCVRLNQFNTSVGKLDQYLAGVVPLPESLITLANMQLAGILGDPMLTGVDKDGTFMLAGFATGAGVQTVVLAPVTSYDQLIQTPACTPAETPDVTLLSAQSSPLGRLALMAAPGGRYAMVMPEHQKHYLPHFHERFARSGSKLDERLTPELTAQAKNAPLWVYFNAAGAYALYGPTAQASIAMMAMQAPQEIVPGDALAARGIALLGEAVELIWGQTDALTLAFDPEPTLANVDITFNAKADSELAGMLTADPQAVPGFTLAGYSDPSAAINAVFKPHRPLLEKLTAKIADILTMPSNDSDDPQQWAAFMQNSIKAMGNETFISYQYGAALPPFMMRQVQHTNDPELFRATLQEALEAANSLYRTMEMPATLIYEPAAESHNTVAIDRIQIQFQMDDTPAELAEFDLMAQMWADDGFTYYVAQKGDLFFTTFGPDALADIRQLIDAPPAAAPAGQLQKAMTILGPAADRADAIAAVNYLKLAKGSLGMMTQLAGPMGEMFAPMAQALDIETQSCMAVSAHIADGKITARLALPRQHLSEVITAVMKMQELMMQMEMQMQEN